MKDYVDDNILSKKIKKDRQILFNITCKYLFI